MRTALTVKEFAKKIGVAPGYVRQLIIAGVIQSEKVGPIHLIPASEIQKARARRTKKGPEPRKKGRPV